MLHLEKEWVHLVRQADGLERTNWIQEPLVWTDSIGRSRKLQQSFSSSRFTIQVTQNWKSQKRVSVQKRGLEIFNPAKSINIQQNSTDKFV